MRNFVHGFSIQKILKPRELCALAQVLGLFDHPEIAKGMISTAAERHHVVNMMLVSIPRYPFAEVSCDYRAAHPLRDLTAS